MNKSIMNFCSRAFLLLSCLMLNVYAFAQDGGATSESHTSVANTTTSNAPDPNAWYSNPVVWIVGVAVLVLIIVAIVASGRNSAQSSVSRTTTTTTRVE